MFNIGDKAIYVRPGSPYYGTEVEILTNLVDVIPPHDHMGFLQGKMKAYIVTDFAGETASRCAKPGWLRKKPPKNFEKQLNESRGDLWTKENASNKWQAFLVDLKTKDRLTSSSG